MKSKSNVATWVVSRMLMLAGVVAIAACARSGGDVMEYTGVGATPTVDYVEALDVYSAPHQDSFLNQLAMNYRSYAIYNARTSGYADMGELFANKAVAAFSGEVPFPESLENWPVENEQESFELYTAYNDLMEQLKNDASYVNPELAAEAQAKFDCWLSASASGQVATANQCRDRFNKTLVALRDCKGGKIVNKSTARVVEQETVVATNGETVVETTTQRTAGTYYPETRGMNAMRGAGNAREGVIVVNNVNKNKYIAEYLPISDGGEGFLDVLLKWNKNLKECYTLSTDAFRRVNSSKYLYDKEEKVLYFELAEVVGIKDLNKNELNPYYASTYGLGIAIKEGIIKHHPKKIIIGIGGSASNDAGSGMLEAMGIKFCDKSGNVLYGMCNSKLKDVYTLGIDSFTKLINNIEFEVLTDVSNPLLGQLGATYVFSPQKGAKVDDLPILEANMNRFNEIVKNYFNIDFKDVPGAGAAGGVGYAFIAFMNASLKLGIDVLLKSYHFDELVDKYDLVITGEGRLDEQSLNGKVISGIMSYNPKSLEFVVGSCSLENIDYKVHAIVPDAATLDEALSKPKECLTRLIKKDFE